MARQGFRTQLRELLCDHFDLEELRTLCTDLDVDYDDLRGEGKTSKARELIAYLGRRSRVPDLVSVCAQERPNVAWPSLPEPSPRAMAEAECSRPVGQAFSTLAELMQIPQVREAVVAFRTAFEAACEQIDLLSDYKRLHDLLHQLQFHCYRPLVQEITRFPGDDVAVSHVMAYELTLQNVVGGAQEIAEQGSIARTDVTWVADLIKAQTELTRALEQLDVRPLKRALGLLNRVLAGYLSRIDTRLNDAARALRLPVLVEAMTCVSDHLDRLDLNPDKVEQFEAGVDALVSLSDDLTDSVEAHDQWQIVDLQLRRIEDNLRWDLSELEMSWPDLKDAVEPLCAGQVDDWATYLAQDSVRLEQALADGNPVHIRQYFQRYRQRAGLRFHNVDLDLKDLCEELRQVDRPLAAVMVRVE